MELGLPLLEVALPLRERIAVVLKAVMSSSQEDRRSAELFLRNAMDADQELRQQVLDILVDFAATDAVSVPQTCIVALMVLRNLSCEGLRLERLFDALLADATRVPARYACPALVRLFGEKGRAVPPEVVERARQRSDSPLALALWLMSSEPDVCVAVEKAMTGSPEVSGCRGEAVSAQPPGGPRQHHHGFGGAQGSGCGASPGLFVQRGVEPFV